MARTPNPPSRLSANGRSKAARAAAPRVNELPASAAYADAPTRLPAIAPGRIDRLVRAAGLPERFGIEALAAAAEAGVPVDVVEELKAWMPASVVTRSIASPSTVSRRLRSGEKLTGPEADRALRVVAILRHAVEVFGDAEKAQRWLSKPKPFLDPAGPGRTPYEMLESEHGARLVEQRLTQIDHGLFA